MSIAALSLVGAPVCPAAQHLPQLTIDEVPESKLPLFDTWQVLWANVPLSDAQLALLAHDDLLVERTERELEQRGTWVYVGTMLTAAGTATSIAGSVLFGQDKLSRGITLSLAIGGLVLGVVGLLTITDAIQTPLEPHLAPTPQHRLSREEARALVARVNDQMYREACGSLEDR